MNYMITLFLAQESFSSGKFSVVKTFTDKYFFNGPQVAHTLKLFSFNSDQLKFLEAVEPVCFLIFTFLFKVFFTFSIFGFWLVI